MGAFMTLPSQTIRHEVATAAEAERLACLCIADGRAFLVSPPTEDRVSWVVTVRREPGAANLPSRL